MREGGGGKFISVNNFSAQERALSKNKHILNFRIMAVRDVFVEKSRDFEPFYNKVAI